MKKVNLTLYYIFFIIYEEIILSCLLFKVFSTSIYLIILFTIPIAIVLSFISNIFKNKRKQNFNIYNFYVFNFFIWRTDGILYYV